MFLSPRSQLCLIFAFLSGVAGVPSAAHEVEFPCFPGVNQSFENANARVSATSYQQNNSRTKARLYKTLGQDFKETYQGLPPNSEILDLGGGFSVYGLEFAADGHRVETVNTQNFYQDSLYPLINTEKSKALLASLTPGRKGRLYLNGPGFGADTIVGLSRALGLEIPSQFRVDSEGLLYLSSSAVRHPEQAAKELAGWVAKIKRGVEAREASGRFSRVTGFAQDRLRAIPSNSKQEVLDEFGAFHYSTDRLDLLAQSYRVLKPGAKAHIGIKLLDDYVRMGDETMRLEELLYKLYPDAFELDWTTEVKTLVMKKSVPIDFAKLKELLGEPHVSWVQTNAGYSRPSLDFDARVGSFKELQERLRASRSP